MENTVLKYLQSTLMKCLLCDSVVELFVQILKQYKTKVPTYSIDIYTSTDSK